MDLLGGGGGGVVHPANLSIITFIVIFSQDTHITVVSFDGFLQKIKLPVLYIMVYMLKQESHIHATVEVHTFYNK